MNLNLSAIGKFIQDGRKHYEMTQAELAEKLGVSPQSVSNWERGESLPDVGLLPDLAQVLHCSVDAILMGGGRVHYHCRFGTHYLSREDWNQYLAYFKRRFFK